MASFKYLIFIALIVYTVAADETKPAENSAEKVKRHAFIAAAPAPVLAYSASVPSAYSYAYSSYPAATYPAVTAYAAPASYATYPAAYAAYPKYAYDDGSYWPGKYEKTYYPAYYKSPYPIAYHY